MEIVNGGRLGDTVRARGGRAAPDIEVQAAPWIDVAEVRLVVNGARRDPLPFEGGHGRVESGPARKSDRQIGRAGGP